MASAIKDTLKIENQPSTQMDDVKTKEDLWKKVRERLQPFLELSHLWISALDGVAVDEFNYLSAAQLLIEGNKLKAKEKREARSFLKSIADDLAVKKADLMPFHWQLEFPDVFFDEQGAELPPGKRGFDAVLGNPPYVSTHTAMEPGNRKMRNALKSRAGYIEDLYVHFADLGFNQLRENGRFGFIVSDTFFTLTGRRTWFIVFQLILLQDGRDIGIFYFVEQPGLPLPIMLLSRRDSKRLVYLMQTACD